MTGLFVFRNIASYSAYSRFSAGTSPAEHKAITKRLGHPGAVHHVIPGRRSRTAERVVPDEWFGRPSHAVVYAPSLKHQVQVWLASVENQGNKRLAPHCLPVCKHSL